MLVTKSQNCTFFPFLLGLRTGGVGMPVGAEVLLVAVRLPLVELGVLVEVVDVFALLSNE